MAVDCYEWLFILNLWLKEIDKFFFYLNKKITSKILLYFSINEFFTI